MKSHDAAKALEQVAAALRRSPNTDLRDFPAIGKEKDPSDSSRNAKIAVNLHTLAQLAKISKSDWVLFIEQNEIPIDIRPRDASRDLIGRLLKFVEEDPRGELILRRAASRPGHSEQLSKAFRVLLGT